MRVGVPLPPRLEPLLDNETGCFMHSVSCGDGRRVMERALLRPAALAPVLEQQLKVEVPRVRLRLSRLDALHRLRAHRNRSEPRRRAKALLRAAAGGVDA